MTSSPPPTQPAQPTGASPVAQLGSRTAASSAPETRVTGQTNLQWLTPSFLLSVNLGLMGILTTVTLATSSVVWNIHRDTTELKGNFAELKGEVTGLQGGVVELKVVLWNSRVTLTASIPA